MDSAINSFYRYSKFIRLLSERLNKNECDALKYRLSIAAANVIHNEGYEPQYSREKFNFLLENLLNIQFYRDRVPVYGLAYKGHPDFLTKDVLNNLIEESESYKLQSIRNLDQNIYQVETNDNVTYAEKLASSMELHKLVNRYAGKSQQSFVTSYLYYNQKGDCSRPHVDNAFTGITVMIGLKQISSNLKKVKLSSSFLYWPNKPRFEYQLEPGEISIFFGACVLHGRTILDDGEVTQLLLLSFRPQEG